MRSQVGRVIGAKTEVRKFAIFCFKSPRALSFSFCPTPNLKGKFLHSKEKREAHPLLSIGSGPLTHPDWAWEIAAYRSGASFLNPGRDDLSCNFLEDDPHII